MFSPRLIFAVGLACQLAYGAYAMNCNVGGFEVSCPTPMNSDDSVFCCRTKLAGMGGCCDVEDFVKENTPMLVGVVIGLIILLIIVTICCCCFCSCCLCARRRVQRGTVYGPLTVDQGVVAQTSFQPMYPAVVHPPSDIPPAYQPSSNPYFNNAYPPAQPQASYKP